MIEIRGRHNTAKVFTNAIDAESTAQIIQLCNQPFTAGSRIRMMPDVHAGAGCTIGTTMTITDKVVPNLVGVDIGCGMEVVRLKETHLDCKKLDDLIYRTIPSGFQIRDKVHRHFAQINLNELHCYDRINASRAGLSLGTLGGGNHFIEAGQDESGALYLVVHSGSRHLGVEVARHYQDLGWKEQKRSYKERKAELVADYQSKGRGAGIAESLKQIEPPVPKELAYVSGDTFRQYIHDMQIVQNYAALNRKAMVDEIIRGMDLHATEQFTTIHNYIDLDNMILRKGAVSAQAGEKLIIPINMRDGSLICTGKGNADWNCSAPHGAGRLMSRSAAKGAFTVSEFEDQMSGVYTSSVNKNTLDECPMAYKPMEEIIGNIGGTVDIINIIKPVYNFKAGN